MIPLTSSFLLDQARRNIWCAPFQDRQLILNLTRISRDGGSLVSQEILWVDTPMPTDDTYYHVYQIGANSSWRTGLPDQRNVWYPLSTWSQANNLVTNLYLADGQQIPLFSSYVLRTEDDCLIVAVKLYKTIWDLDANTLYMRVYNNAFFQSVRSANVTDKVIYGGGVLTNVTTQVAGYKASIAHYRTQAGEVDILVNGVWVSDLLASTLSIGDIVEWRFDAAVSRVVDFKVSTLSDFTSTLDKLKKYVLHPSKNGPDEESIYFSDDIDIFIYTVGSNNLLSGRYYNRNRENSLRNITHVDYTIPVGYVQAFITDGWTTQDNTYIRLHLRESGFSRALIDESSRISILYRLTDVDILRAMLGLDATISEWQVDNLESSLYTTIMRSNYLAITTDQVKSAYGFNSLSRLFALTPTAVTEDQNGNYVTLPYGLTQRSCVWEYDENGVLIGAKNHAFSERYFMANQNATMAEAVQGWGTKAIPWVPSNDSVLLDDTYQYFFFTSQVNAGVLANVWTPAVLGTDYTIDSTNTLQWIHVKARNMGLILSTAYNLTYSQNLLSSDGIYTFTLTYSDTPGTVLPIEPGMLDIFINGHSAIEGLDYIMDGLSGTFISNRYFTDSGDQKLTVRGFGWVTATQPRVKPRNVGFVYQGYLSKNGTFDVREDKVTRIVVDGTVRYPDQMPWIENADTFTGDLLKNGLAYAESILPTPLYGMSTDENTALYAASLESDSRVSDYMTLKFPEKVLTGPNPIDELYPVFSPTLTRLFYEVQNNLITIPVNPKDFIALDNLMKNYTDYLAIDPCRFTVNQNYMRIDAHPFSTAQEVTLATWVFLGNVNTRYLNGRLNLANFFIVKG